MQMTRSAESEDFVLERLVFTSKASSFLEWLRRWSRSHSLWPMPFGASCCSLEYQAAMGPRYDLGRPRGGDEERFSPEQSDLMIVAGTVTEKLAPVLKRIYNKMSRPNWVIAMGACASSGGPYRTYNVVQGIDRLIPVDVYIPGCPPTPEALIEGVIKVQKRIRSGVGAKA